MTPKTLARSPSVSTSDNDLPRPYLIAFTCDFQSQKPLVARQVACQIRQTHPAVRVVTINESTPLSEFPLSGPDVAQTVFVVTALETLAVGNNSNPKAALFKLFLSGLTSGDQTPLGYVIVTAGQQANRVAARIAHQHNRCAIPRNGGQDYLNWILQEIIARDDRRLISLEDADCYVRTFKALIKDAMAGHPKLDGMMDLAAVNISQCNLPWALHLAGHRDDALELFQHLFGCWQRTVLTPGSLAIIMLDNLLRYLGGQERMTEAQAYLDVLIEQLPVASIEDMNAPLLQIIRGLNQGFVEQGRAEDASIVLDLLLQSAETRNNWPVKLWGLLQLAALPGEAPELALVYARKALTAARVIGSHKLVQQAVLLVCSSLVDTGNYAEVENFLGELETEARAQDDTSMLGLIYQERAVVLDYQGQSDEAARLQRNAVKLLRRSAPDPKSLSHPIRTLGVMEYRAGQIGRARAHFKKAFQLLEGDNTVGPADLGSEFARWEAENGHFGHAARWSVTAARSVIDIDFGRAISCILEASSYHDQMPLGKTGDAIEAEIEEVFGQLCSRAAPRFT